MEEDTEIRQRENNDRRTCWVCFLTDEDDPTQQWLRPCKCKGTTKWVHNSCLQQWFDEKQRGIPTVKVYCPQCIEEYTIKYPPLGPVLLLIDYVEKSVNKISPMTTAGAVVGSLYWSACSYGGLTVLQVLGYKETVRFMKHTDPLFLMVALPIIPLGLILGKMIRWEDQVLQKWREYSQRWWFLKKLFGGGEGINQPIRRHVDPNYRMDFVDTTRVISGALILPTIATTLGNYFFERVESPIKRAVMGGCLYLSVKGFVKLYYKQQQHSRLERRQIQNYVETSNV